MRFRRRTVCSQQWEHATSKEESVSLKKVKVDWTRNALRGKIRATLMGNHDLILRFPARRASCSGKVLSLIFPSAESVLSFSAWCFKHIL